MIWINDIACPKHNISKVMSIDNKLTIERKHKPLYN